jgi:hypothetical protein
MNYLYTFKIGVPKTLVAMNKVFAGAFREYLKQQGAGEVTMREDGNTFVFETIVDDEMLKQFDVMTKTPEYAKISRMGFSIKTSYKETGGTG